MAQGGLKSKNAHSPVNPRRAESPMASIAQGKRSDTLGEQTATSRHACKGKSKHNRLYFSAFALTIIFADEKKEEKNSFILYTFVKFALVTEQKLNIEEYSISSVNPVPFQA